MVELLRRAPRLCEVFNLKVICSRCSHFKHVLFVQIPATDAEFALLIDCTIVKVMGMRVIGFMHDMIVMMTFAPTVRTVQGDLETL